MPRAMACGTVRFTKRWRSSSFVLRLTRHLSSSALLGEFVSLGPNIMRAGHQNRLTDSCSMAFCVGVPLASTVQIS